MKNKYFNLFMLFITIVGITFAISSIVKSYFAEAINIQKSMMLKLIGENDFEIIEARVDEINNLFEYE